MLRRDRCPLRRASVAYAVSLAVAVAASLVTCARCCRLSVADSFIAECRALLLARDAR